MVVVVFCVKGEMVFVVCNPRFGRMYVYHMMVNEYISTLPRIQLHTQMVITVQTHEIDLRETCECYQIAAHKNLPPHAPLLVASYNLCIKPTRGGLRRKHALHAQWVGGGFSLLCL